MKFSLKASVLALALVWGAAPVNAAGLGKLTVLSGLGQPLRAEVELKATNEELGSMSARLASHEAFSQAGIEFTPALAAVKLAVERRADGTPIVLVTSTQPLTEPFLDMLVEVRWSAGRLVREYTFLLDPPALRATQRAEAPVQAPAAAPRAAPVATQRAAAPPAATPPAAATTREVKRGDTLHRIATESRHEGVSLDQMLVSIFQRNQEAFEGNMNRLRAGAILTIPGRSEAATVAQPEARRQVLSQAEDFAAYRRKLAGVVAQSQARDAPARQADTGKIVARAEEKQPEAAVPKDQLKVSKASVAAAEAPRSDRAAQARITALEEDLVAKEKSLKESSSRIAELEKNIRELQKLLELKNQSLADAQKQASAKAAPEPAKPEPAAAPPAPAPAAEAKPAPEAKPAEVAVAPPPKPAVETKPEPKPEAKPESKPEPKPAVVPPAPAPEASFMDDLLDNPLLLFGGGGAVLAGLGLLGYRLSQRRKPERMAMPTTAGATAGAQSVFGSTGGQSVDTSASSIQTDFSQSGLSSIDTDEGVDPVAEADVYMAYGRDAQAEEILLDALKNEPTRHAIHAKLLEIYAQRKSTKQFETLASELYAQTGGSGAEWDKAAALGRKVDPGNPLFSGDEGAAAPAVAVTERTVVAPSPEKLRDTWTMPGELGQIASAAEEGSAASQAATVVLPASAQADAAGAQGAQALDLDFDLGTPETAAPAASESKPQEGATPLDFDLGFDSLSDLKPAGRELPVSEQATVVMDPGAVDKALSELGEGADEARAAAGRGGVDFDLGQAEDTQQAGAGTAVDAVNIESTDVRGNVIDLSFEKEAPPAAEADAQVMDLEHTDIGASLMQFQLDGDRPQRESSAVDLEKTDLVGDVLSFDLNLDEVSARSPSAGAQPAAPAGGPQPMEPIDLSNIDLDLGGSPAGSAAPEAAAGDGEAAEDEINQDVVTKLELAVAYEEMGDKDGARELLEEVLKEGNSGQQQRARDILARLA